MPRLRVPAPVVPGIMTGTVPGGRRAAAGGSPGCALPLPTVLASGWPPWRHAGSRTRARVMVVSRLPSGTLFRGGTQAGSGSGSSHHSATEWV